MMIRLAKRKCQEQPNIVHGERNEAAAEAPPASAPSEAAAQEAQPPASPAPEHLASPQQQNDDGQPPEAQHGSEDQAGDQGAADAEQQAERGWLLASHLSPPPQPPPLDLEAEVEKLKRFLPEQLPAASQVQWLLSQALALAVNNTNDESAASVASSFMASFQDCLSKRVSAARQLLQQGGPAELEAFDRLPPFIRKQCASDRLAAALRQQLDKLQQEEKAWAALQDKYSRVAGAGEASSAPGSATGQGGGEVQEQQQQQQQAVVDLQPMVAVQERADMQLGFQVGDMCTCHPCSALGMVPVLRQPLPAATASVRPCLQDWTMVKRVTPQAASHRCMFMSGSGNMTAVAPSLQVEAIHTMLERAEQLVEQAQQACTLLQVSTGV